MLASTPEICKAKLVRTDDVNSAPFSVSGHEIATPESLLFHRADPQWQIALIDSLNRRRLYLGLELMILNHWKLQAWVKEPIMKAG